MLRKDKNYTVLGEITFLRTYSKIKEDNSKENWEETVDRYFNYLHSRFPKIERKSIEEARSSVKQGQVVPSMRLLQFAGKHIDKFEVAAYNCSFLNINSLLSFSEVLYLNMSGVGVGFGIDRRSISKLPKIEPFKGLYSPFYFPVKDSTWGWVVAYKIALRLRWSGWKLLLDLSRVRPKDSPLSRGGYSSGPEGLENMLTATFKVMDEAAGRRLKSIEVFDILCFNTYYVSGGAARRVATISLSDLKDKEMQEAKKGEFYNKYPFRSFCNNSVKYYTKPTLEEFSQEWNSLRENQTGERGIFNVSELTEVFPKRRKIGPLEERGTNPCGEIELRDCQFCNLSEVIVRPEDSFEELKEKCRIASLIGTWQSLFTNFDERLLRPKWKWNTGEERLLGVSLTGVLDHVQLRENQEILKSLKRIIVETNREEAQRLGINPSTATTCVKPSGTVSTVFNTASGVHPRFARFYLRRVRFHQKDVIPKVLKEAGYTVLPDPYSKANVYVEFPVKAPKDSLFASDLNAIDQLNYWKHLKVNYCEHNPSFTCYIKSNEWEEVKDWIWKNWSLIGGLSFLPLLDHVYKAAPYEAISEEKFNKIVSSLKKINWDIIYLKGKDTRDSVSGCDKCNI